MKNTQLILTLALALSMNLLSASAFASPSTPFKPTLQQLATILGLAASANDPDGVHLPSVQRKQLASILSGQSYEKRVSVIGTKCSKEKADTAYITCWIRVGNDDLNDGDSGWSFVWEVQVTLDSKLTYIEAMTWEGIAG